MIRVTFTKILQNIQLHTNNLLRIILQRLNAELPSHSPVFVIVSTATHHSIIICSCLPDSLTAQSAFPRMLLTSVHSIQASEKIHFIHVIYTIKIYYFHSALTLSIPKICKMTVLYIVNYEL